MTRGRALVYLGRLVTLVVIVGGWQLFTDWKIVDPFFFGHPSGIVSKLWFWINHGTEYGSPCSQVWVTMKEALLGFVFGVDGSIVFGVLLAPIRFLSDVLHPYIKAAKALHRTVLVSL